MPGRKDALPADLKAAAKRTDTFIEGQIKEFNRAALVWSDAARDMVSNLSMDPQYHGLFNKWHMTIVEPADHQSREMCDIVNILPEFWDSVLGSSLPWRYDPDKPLHNPDKPRSINHRIWTTFWNTFTLSKVKDATLPDIVRRVAEAHLSNIAGQMPDAAAVARRLADHVEETPRLSTVMEVLRALNSYAETAPPLEPAAIQGVDEVWRYLTDIGVKVRRDIRSLEHPSALAKDMDWQSYEWVVCDRCRCAIDIEVSQLVILRGNMVAAMSYGVYTPEDGDVVRVASCRACSGDVWFDFSGAFKHGMSELEKIVMRSIGEPGDKTPDIHAALAFKYGMTVDQVKAIFSSEESPVGDEPEPCPLAKVCNSHCGSSYRKGRRIFPLTPTGAWQDCEYHGFLVEARANGLAPDGPTDPLDDMARLHNEARSRGSAQAALF